MTNYFIYQTPIGKVAIAEEAGAVTALCTEKGFSKKKKGAVLRETPLLRRAAKQLNDYFEGKLKKFDLPLNPKGTSFQKEVWQALTKIPYGKTVSYKDMAEKIKNPKAARAVGGANNKNPIFIVIPCHRVIGADGRLTGYACGLDTKKFLLAVESYYS
jgi:methylated-DNA-[protein]-cysteine S-methyltransferase